jgi:hypothetical protein
VLPVARTAKHPMATLTFNRQKVWVSARYPCE